MQLFIFFALCWFICFFFNFFLKTKNDFFQNIVFCCMIISFIFLCATRSIYYTADTWVYNAHFNSARTHPNVWADIEYGYTLFVSFLNIVLFGNRYLFFAAFPIINLSIVYLCAHRLKYDTRKIVLAYIAAVGLFFSFTILRSGLAFGFLFLAYMFYRTVEDKRLKYILSSIMVALAVLFHITALIIISLWVLYLIKFPDKNWFYFSLIGFGALLHFFGVFALFNEHILMNIPIAFVGKYAAYFATTANNNVLVLHIFLILFVWAVLIRDKNSIEQTNICKILAFLLFAYLALYSVPVVVRLRPFFLCVLILFMVHAGRTENSQHKNWKCFMVFILFCITSMSFLNSMIN